MEVEGALQVGIKNEEMKQATQQSIRCGVWPGLSNDGWAQRNELPHHRADILSIRSCVSAVPKQPAPHLGLNVMTGGKGLRRCLFSEVRKQNRYVRLKAFPRSQIGWGRRMPAGGST